MAEPVLQFQAASFGYDESPVLRGINLTIYREQVTIIAGASGCGKSTLLRGAIGLLAPLEGRVRLLGAALDELSETALARLRRRVGLLFQGGALINSLTVAENVALPIRQFSRLPEGVVRRLVQLKLAQVGLEGEGGKFPPELSGGMRKRAALARALALDPELLLCDEPTAGLDPVTAAGLDRLLLELRRTMGMSLVVVTHEVGSIETIADRVIMLAGGSVAFDGSLEDVRRSTDGVVSDFFSRRALPAAARGRSELERFAAPVAGGAGGRV